jgi:hypothetical protein
MNITDNYNHDSEGCITTDFLNEVIKQHKQPKYLTIKGYFNTPHAMTLQEVLNYMWSKNYDFQRFITLDRIIGEMIFKKV